ncbi:bacteriophage protein [Salmonella enterica subsp. enterica]|uniref:Bacteriophage protein n=1 Tax=Salmonella enterica I TaxID=59201 RepID=A0A379W7J9_SALET|nr:bacteriophage protein [Salmonella enterica subsp. enterica]
MNDSQFKQAAGISAELAARWYPHITAAMSEFGITAPLDQACLLHKRDMISRIYCSEGKLHYSVEALKKTFGNALRLISAKCWGVLMVARWPPAAIANLVYGGRMGTKTPEMAGSIAGVGLSRLPVVTITTSAVMRWVLIYCWCTTAGAGRICCPIRSVVLCD